MSRYFIEIAYKGTRYSGWQVQQNSVSVQQKINEAFSTILNTPIHVVGASRTDAGVHARQTFAHFDADNIEKDTLYKINKFLPADIAIKQIKAVSPNAHARFDAISRSYEYIIYFEKDPFMKELGYYYTFGSLNVEKMQQAANLLKNHEDYFCFGKAGMQVKTTLCKIKKAEWKFNEKGHLLFHITADRFLRGMVRGIVGTLLRVGQGKYTTEDFNRIIEEKDRASVDFSVPPEGLYLTEVRYS